MAFNINAHVVLSGPKNIKAVTKSIQKQLGSVKVGIRLDAPKNLNRQIASFNKSIGTLQTRVDSLAASAGRANTNLASLATSFNSLNTASSKMAKSQGAVQNSLDKSGKAIHGLRGEVQAFGKDAALAVRRFAAFTVATGAVFGFVRAVQSATKAALDYEREITKIVQVTGAGQAKIEGLNRTIDGLANSLGVNANELAELARIFAQTGQSIDQVQASIRAVARSSLAPTFGSMKDTAEGLIAAMAQFNIAAHQQEAVLASLNAVSKKFAVESEDLISVIRRAGGVFAASRQGFEEPIEGLQQLIGIFTAVRSTTRESADTIAVGLRTIFTRIQRRGTIDFLKQFNIDLVDAKGNFIGLFPAFQALSKGLDDIIKRGDAVTLSKITEELGGVRQVGKLIPAITKFNKALAATEIAAQAAGRGLGSDVALALQPLGKQFELLQQRFQTFIRTITESKTFQNLAKVALSLGNAFLSIAEALTPLIPLMTSFAAIKLSRGLVDFSTGFIGGLKKGGGAGGAGGALGSAMTGGGGGSGGQSNQGLISSNQKLTVAIDKVANQMSPINTSIGNLQSRVGEVNVSIKSLIGALGRLQLGGGVRGGFGGFGGGRGGRRPRKFAKGGYVSGPSHAQGGVPAILEGGEYVIPKGYASGGIASKYGAIALSPMDDVENSKGKVIVGKGGKGEQSLAQYLARRSPSLFNAAKNRSDTRVTMSDYLGTIKRALGGNSLSTSVIGKTFGSAALDREIGDDVDNAISNLIRGTADKLGVVAGAKRTGSVSRALLDSVGTRSTIGSIFEGGLSLLGAPYDRNPSKEQDAFDFPFGLGPSLGAKFQGLGDIPTEAKKDLTTSLMQDIASRKATNFIGEQIFSGALFQGLLGKLNRPKTKVQRRAAGGSIFSRRGTDTVPAMLTPGEFVINKSSAQKVGYGNLSKINRYAQGGVVNRPGLPMQMPNFGGGKSATGDVNQLGVSASSAAGALTALTMTAMTFNTEDPFGSLLQMMPLLAYQMDSITQLFTTLNSSFTNLMKSTKGLGGKFKALGSKIGSAKGFFGAALAASITGPIVNAISGAAVKAFIGVEKRLGNVQGIEGASAKGGAAAGGLKAAGTATQIVMIGGQLAVWAAKLPGIGVALAVVIGALTALAAIVTVVTGAMKGYQQQLDFIAMTRIDESMKLFRTEIEKLKEDLSNTEAFTKATDAFNEAFAQQQTFVGRKIDVGGQSMFGETASKIGGMMDNPKLLGYLASIGALPAVELLSFGGGTLGTTNEMGLAGGVHSSTVGRVMQAAGGWLTGGTEGMRNAWQDSSRENEARRARVQTVSTALSDANAMVSDDDRKALADVTSSQLDKVMDSVNSSMLKQIVGLGDNLTTLQGTMAGLSGNADTANESFEKLQSQLLATRVFKDVEEELKQLGTMSKAMGDTEMGRKATKDSQDLATAFTMLNSRLDLATASSADYDRVLKEIEDKTGINVRVLRQLIDKRRKVVAEEMKDAATLEILNREAAKAKRGIDALAAGLEQFGARTAGIGDMAERAATRASEAFSQVIGERTVGQVDRFSPFENLAAASDSQIDAGVARLQGMGGQQEGGVAFQGLGQMLKAGRDLPLAMKTVSDQLTRDTETGKTLSDQDVKESMAKALGGGNFANLPAEVQEIIMKQLENMKGGRAGDNIITADVLNKMLAEDGDMIKLLGPVFGKLTAELGKADKAVLQFQNAILQVADLEQQMMKRRLENQLAIQSKENSIRDRVNKAMGKTPNLINQAFGDLRSRNRKLVGGGRKFGGIGMMGEDPIDPTALGANIRNLEAKADAERKRLGIGQDEDPQAVIDRMQAGGSMSKEALESAKRLAGLNAEINGSKQALKELANDTRVLAAMEQELARVKSKEKAASATGVSIVKGLTDLRSGRITGEQFGQQIVSPLQNVEDAFSGQIGTEGAIDLLGRIEGGDQLTGGLINRKIAEIATATGKDEGTVRQEFIRNLTDGIIKSGIGMAGDMGKGGIKKILETMLGDAGDMRSEAEKITDAMKSFGEVQIQALKEQQALEEAGFERVMQKVAQDFDMVVKEFAKAILEFSKFRSQELGQTFDQTGLTNIINAPSPSSVAPPRPMTAAGMRSTADAIVAQDDPANIAQRRSSGGGADEFQAGLQSNYLPQLPVSVRQVRTSRAARLMGAGGTMDETRSRILSLEAKRKELGDPTSVHGRKKAKILDKKIEREKERARRQNEAFQRNATDEQIEQEKRRREKENQKEQQRQAQRFTGTPGEAIQGPASGGTRPRSVGMGTPTPPPSPAVARGELPTTAPMTPADLTKIFTDGAKSIASVITTAFEALPTTIQLKAELGAITINLAGGQFLEQFRAGIVQQLKDEIKEGTIRGMTGVTGEATSSELSPDTPSPNTQSNVTPRSQQSALTRRFSGRRGR